MPRMSRNEESEEKGEGRGGKRKELLGLMFRKLTIFSLPTTYLPSQCKVPWPGKALKLLWEAGMIGPDSIPQHKRSLFFLFIFIHFPNRPSSPCSLLVKMLEITAESSSSYGHIPIKLVLWAMRGRSRLVNVPFYSIELNGLMGLQ